MDQKTITLTLITEEETNQLRAFVAKCRKSANKPSIHNCVMSFLDSQPAILERFRERGVIKAYGAYLLEWAIKLQ